MKILSRLSLRMRMTLLTGLIVFATSLGLTLTSMYNVRSQFVSVSLLEKSIATIPMSDIVQFESAIPATAVTPAETISGYREPVEITLKALPAPFIDAKKEFDMNSLLYLLVTSVVGMAAAYIVSGRALRPVRELNRTIVRITGQNLEERITDSGASDEISSLSRSFNAMLDRLEQSFLRQKRFSANVAHELKTPLATMNAGMQVLSLESQPTVEECMETLEIAERNVKRLTSVVDDLFLLTDEREMDYSDPIPLTPLFQGLLSELTPLYADKKLKILCEIQIEEVMGNRTLVQRAFFNLLENAMKYSQDGGTVAICGKSGQISISNKGEGIPQADIDKIFEPFYRVDQSRSRKIGGAGLGLSIVKAIAEKHGWTVKAESIPDVGTVMTVLLGDARDANGSGAL